MAKNWEYINITDAMIDDFYNLTLLDLTEDDFVCNDGVVHFVRMADTAADTLEVVGWSGGYGYYCRDMDTGATKSFREYVDRGTPLNEGFVAPPGSDAGGNEVYEAEKVSVVAIVLPLLATVALVPFVAVLANVVYNNRWYLEYRWAKYRLRRKRRRMDSTERDDSSFAYDAFVSYNREDADFVQQCLVATLEREETAERLSRRLRRLRLCVHERDFQAGRTIIENIVSSLEQSRSCIIVMSRAYARSEWCRFEALMALQLFQEDERDVLAARRAIVVVKRNEVPGSLLGKTLKSVMKLRTYLEWKDKSTTTTTTTTEEEDREGEARRKESVASGERALAAFEARLRLSLDCLDDEDEGEEENKHDDYDL